MIINVINIAIYLVVLSLLIHVLVKIKYKFKNILFVSIFTFLFFAQFIVGKKIGLYFNFVFLIIFPLYILILIFKSNWKVWMSLTYAVVSVAFLSIFSLTNNSNIIAKPKPVDKDHFIDSLYSIYKDSTKCDSIIKFKLKEIRTE
jgi:hypothetical protein